MPGTRSPQASPALAPALFLADWIPDLTRRPRLLAGLLVLAALAIGIVLLRRRRARRLREEAARRLAAGEVHPFQFEEACFRGFVPACPEAEGIFVRAFHPMGEPRFKALAPAEVSAVRFPSPNRPTYGYSIFSASKTLSVVPGTRLELAMKGRGKRTFVVRRGFVADRGHAWDLSGMIGSWRPGSRSVRLYRHYDESLLPLSDLLERVDHLEERQRARRAELERAIADGEPIDFAGENLFGMDLSGLDLRGVTSIEGADLRYVDVKGAVFSKRLRWLRRPWLLRWPRRRWSHMEGTRFREAEFR